MSRHSRASFHLLTAALLVSLVAACSGASTPVASSTNAAQSTGLPSGADDGSSDDASPGDLVFAGTSDSVVAEVTDASFTCGDPGQMSGFALIACTEASGATTYVLDVYSRPSGDVAGVVMTLTGIGASDPDSIQSFMGLGLGGAMGPDAFNAVNDQASSRLDGSAPDPVWVSPALRLTITVAETSTVITVLAPDLAAVWPS